MRTQDAFRRFTGLTDRMEEGLGRHGDKLSLAFASYVSLHYRFPPMHCCKVFAADCPLHDY